LHIGRRCHMTLLLELDVIVHHIVHNRIEVLMECKKALAVLSQVFLYV